LNDEQLAPIKRCILDRRNDRADHAGKLHSSITDNKSVTINYQLFTINCFFQEGSLIVA
jgi:hypothetical protein